MGLDIYVGPLCRYYGGKWQTIIQQWGETAGVSVNVVRPSFAGVGPIWSKLASFVASLRRPDPITVVCSWRDRLAKNHPAGPGVDWNWPESPELAYMTDRPGFDGYGAVQLWAAYAEQPDVTPPESVPPDSASDSVIQKAIESTRRFHHILEPELWLPVHFQDVFEAAEPSGYKPKIGSVFALWSELQLLNSLSWRADETAVRAWRQDDWDPQNLESIARWAFSIWYCLTEFAVANRLPIRLDY